MGIQANFLRILESAKAGKPDTLEITIDGECYLRNFRPEERLLILGAGHVAQPVCSFAAQLGFAVTVVDDRPSFANQSRFPEAVNILCDSFPSAIQRFGITENDYVVIVTRGHRWDADCLRCIFPGTFPRYLGMIGSKRRTVGLLNLLEEEGHSRALLDRIHTPIGVDIGALTVKEIGISIVAELIACRRSGSKRRSKSATLVSEDVDIPLLEMLADPKQRKCLLLVYETAGSTPVKSGAMMAVDDRFQTAGTIGGGCSENAVLRDAFHMIGTGETRCVTIDMSNDVAEEEGMVCGGTMKVLIEDGSEA